MTDVILGPAFAFYGLIVLVSLQVVLMMLFLRNEKKIQRIRRPT